MRSDRFVNALGALKSDSMPVVIEAVTTASAAGYAMGLLHAISEPFVDALCIVMYAGRDEFMEGYPYDEYDIDRQFSDWWDYLGMDSEDFAREQMAEKVPLGKYLRKGAYMFRIDSI